MSMMNRLSGMLLVGILLVSVSAYAGPWDTNLLVNGSFDDATAPALDGWTVGGGVASSTATTPPSAPNVLAGSSAWGHISQTIDLLSAGFTQAELDNAQNLAIVVEVPAWNTAGTYSADNKCNFSVNLGAGEINFGRSNGFLGSITTDVQSNQAVVGGGGSFNLSYTSAPVTRTWTLTNIPDNMNSVYLDYWLLGNNSWSDDLSVKIVELPDDTADITITNTGFNTATQGVIYTGDYKTQGQTFTPSVNDGFTGATPETVYMETMQFWAAAALDSATGFDGTTPVYLNIYSDFEAYGAGPLGFVGSSTNSVIFENSKSLVFEMDDLALDYDSEYFAVFSTTPTAGDVYGQGVMWENANGYAGGKSIYDNRFGAGDNDQAFIAEFSLTPTEVPEPSTLVLLLGMVGAFFVIRRRK